MRHPGIRGIVWGSSPTFLALRSLNHPHHGAFIYSALRRPSTTTLLRRYATANRTRKSNTAYTPRIFVPSVGQIADPLVPPSGLALLNPANLWKRLRSFLQDSGSIWQIRSHLKKEPHWKGFFFLGKWTAEAIDNYQRFCGARARSDKKALKELTTDNFFDVLKGTIIPTSNTLTREWRAENVRAKVLALRMVELKQPPAKFAQVLIRFTSQQVLKVKNAKGILVAGSESPISLTEYYVLERPLQDVHLFKWKFLGKLDPANKEPLAKPMLEQ